MGISIELSEGDRHAGDGQTEVAGYRGQAWHTFSSAPFPKDPSSAGDFLCSNTASLSHLCCFTYKGCTPECPFLSPSSWLQYLNHHLASVLFVLFMCPSPLAVCEFPPDDNLLFILCLAVSIH